MRLDLLLSRLDLHLHTAVELKYLTAGWTGEVGGEHFALKNHGAQDVRAYDAVKDLGRLERFVRGKKGWNGLFIGITNDPSFWRPVTHGRTHQRGRLPDLRGDGPDWCSIVGAEDWGSGTMRGREASINLTGDYRLRWREFSRVDNSARGAFRALVLVAEPAS